MSSNQLASIEQERRLRVTNIAVGIVLIAMLAGITSAYVLVGVFAINAAMIWFGLLSLVPAGTSRRESGRLLGLLLAPLR